MRRLETQMHSLEMQNVPIHLVCVHAHCREALNEIADWLAKCGMENMRMMNRWSRVKQIYDEREWVNISSRAVRRECMKVAMKRTREE